jgi:hypothetical protein
LRGGVSGKWCFFSLSEVTSLMLKGENRKDVSEPVFWVGPDGWFQKVIIVLYIIYFQ